MVHRVSRNSKSNAFSIRIIQIQLAAVMIIVVIETQSALDLHARRARNYLSTRYAMGCQLESNRKGSMNDRELDWGTE